ncbi:hypothetical protein LP419_40030 [Massilia sp. H-1]|nr:hypothetical protein LP419_40030 [Massilia sp. H-1]
MTFASGLPGPVAGQDLPWRTPRLERPPVPAHPRTARHELRRLCLHRSLPARHVPVLP